MTGQLGARVTEDMLEHGYKELTLLPDREARTPSRSTRCTSGQGRIHADRAANLDGSFTVTLFLALAGRKARHARQPRIRGAFFHDHFPDVAPLMPGLAREFLEHPVGAWHRPYDRWSAPGARRVARRRAHPSCRSTGRA